MAGAAGGAGGHGKRQEPHLGQEPYRALEAQQAEMRAALQRVTGIMADMLRIMLLDRGGGTRAPDDILCMIRDLEAGPGGAAGRDAGAGPDRAG